MTQPTLHPFFTRKQFRNGYASVVCGKYLSGVIDAQEGNAYLFGRNHCRQLGCGSQEDIQSSPFKLKLPSPSPLNGNNNSNNSNESTLVFWTQLSFSSYHTLLLSDTHQVYACGLASKCFRFAIERLLLLPTLYTRTELGIEDTAIYGQVVRVIAIADSSLIVVESN